MYHAATFIQANKLYFDGAIETRGNVRSLLYDLAPKFLCNFVIKNGQFGLTPAVPADENGNIKDVVVPIAEVFSDGNIIEDSLKVSFLEAEERRDITAILKYRRNRYRELPEEMTVRVRWKESGNENVDNTIDMTQFCTSRAHAELVGRFFLSIRRRIDHTISFKTVPTALYIGPGDYIKVFSQTSPYYSSRNGVVQSDGKVVAAGYMPDGTYTIDFYRPNTDSVETGTITIVNGYVTDPSFNGIVFTAKDPAQIAEHVYQVEQLTIDEEGMVDVSASFFPVDDRGVSLITNDLLDNNLFESLP